LPKTSLLFFLCCFEYSFSYHCHDPVANFDRDQQFHFHCTNNSDWIHFPDFIVHSYCFNWDNYHSFCVADAVSLQRVKETHCVLLLHWTKRGALYTQVYHWYEELDDLLACAVVGRPKVDWAEVLASGHGCKNMAVAAWAEHT
jgi:hypothetical protein